MNNKTKFLTAIMAIGIAVILSSCSSTNQVASSFGKRKYVKGYYLNMPSDKRDYLSSTPQTASITTVPRYDKTESPAMEKPKAVDPKTATYTTAIPLLTKSPAIYKKNTLGKNEVDLTAQTQNKATPVENSVQNYNSQAANDGGDASKNWAAIAGFICAFFFPLIGLIFSIIGLKSEHKSLATAGMVISIILMVIIILVVLK